MGTVETQDATGGLEPVASPNRPGGLGGLIVGMKHIKALRGIGPQPTA